MPVSSSSRDKKSLTLNDENNLVKGFHMKLRSQAAEDISDNDQADPIIEEVEKDSNYKIEKMSETPSKASKYLTVFPQLDRNSATPEFREQTHKIKKLVKFFNHQLI